MNRHLLLSWLMILTLSGCASIPEWRSKVRSWLANDPLELVVRMSELEDQDDRNELAASVFTAYEQEPDNEQTLRLAVIRSIPGHYLSNDAEALVLLEALDDPTLKESQRKIVGWLAPNLKYRMALRESNTDLREDLESVQSALARAREKIEILTRIEQTMGPNPEVEK